MTEPTTAADRRQETLRPLMQFASKKLKRNADYGEFMALLDAWTAAVEQAIEAEARQQDGSALREVVADGWQPGQRPILAAFIEHHPRGAGCECGWRANIGEPSSTHHEHLLLNVLAALPSSAPAGLDVERLAAQNEAWLHLFQLIVEAAGDLTLVLENNGVTITTLTFGEGSPRDAATGLPLEPHSFAVNGVEPSDRLTRALARAVELVGPENVKVGRFRAEYARLEQDQR